MALAPDDPRRQLFGTVGFDKSLAGIELTEVDAGHAVAEITVADPVQNWVGTLHGGAIKYDLDYVVDGYASDTCDLWEEVRSDDFFWNRFTMRAALTKGASFAKFKGDDTRSSIYAGAAKAVEAAGESLRQVPEKIALAKKLVVDRNATVSTLETERSSIIRARGKKAAFIDQVGQLASMSRKEADAKEADSVLSKANAKFDETIALLKQDLSDTDNRIAQKQQEVTDAENAVVAARKGLLEALKLRESAPQVLAEKEKALAEAKAKHGASKASFDAFKAKFDQQASVTEDLLKKYLAALPK